MKRDGKLVGSRQFGQRLRRHHFRLRGIGKRLVFEAEWQQSLRPPPRGRAPEEVPTIEELIAKLDGWCEGCDELTRERIARRKRPTHALFVTRLRRRKVTVSGRRLRIDDPWGRERAWQLMEIRDRADAGAILTEDAVDRILSAPALPIPFFEDEHGPRAGTSGLWGPELARAIAADEVDILAWWFSHNRILTQRDEGLERHTDKTIKLANAFADLLFHNESDLICSDYPSARLAHLRQEVLDFLRHLKDYRRHSRYRPLKMDWDHRSDLEQFIADDLRGAYERIYRRTCGVSRKSDQSVSGPYHAFASAFFREVSLCAPKPGLVRRKQFPAPETIARYLRPRAKEHPA